MRAEIPSGRDPSPKDLEDLADALGRCGRTSGRKP